MTTYTYSGRLTDFSEQPFPDASPRVWVEAPPALSASGVLASKRIPVTVASNGYFTVQLVSSADTTPPAQYVLRVEWITSMGIVGWSEWQFTAVHGGGALSSGVDAPASVWFVGPPWPLGLPNGFYYDKYTDDVGRR